LCRYHWALIVGAKDEGKNDTGKRYHAKERLVGPGRSQWEFEERDVSIAPTSMLLVRVLVAKVANMDRLASIVRTIPIQQDKAGWNCVSWVQEALRALKGDGKTLGTSVADWDKVRDAAMSYVQKKKDEHRFDGEGDFDMQKAPTFDLTKGRETIR
jgi:hypothetical protein